MVYVYFRIDMLRSVPSLVIALHRADIHMKLEVVQ